MCVHVPLSFRQRIALVPRASRLSRAARAPRPSHAAPPHRHRYPNRKLTSPQSEHKALHKSQSNLLHHIIPPKVVSEPDPATGAYNPFPAFHYTGRLRPVYPLSPKRVIPKSIPHPEWSEDGIPKYRARPGRTKVDILDAKAQDAMRKVCRLAREVLDVAAAAIRPGVTTDYIDEIVHNACIERNVSDLAIRAS